MTYALHSFSMPSPSFRYFFDNGLGTITVMKEMLHNIGKRRGERGGRERRERERAREGGGVDRGGGGEERERRGDGGDEMEHCKIGEGRGLGDE